MVLDVYFRFEGGWCLGLVEVWMGFVVVFWWWVSWCLDVFIGVSCFVFWVVCRCCLFLELFWLWVCRLVVFSMRVFGCLYLIGFGLWLICLGGVGCLG